MPQSGQPPPVSAVEHYVHPELAGPAVAAPSASMRAVIVSSTGVSGFEPVAASAPAPRHPLRRRPPGEAPTPRRESPDLAAARQVPQPSWERE